MANLNFDGGSQQVPVKEINVGERLVTIDPRIEIENMGVLGAPSYAYKLLPVQRVTDEYVSGDIAEQKPIVLAKGTIVSLLSAQTNVESGIPGPSASGDIPVYESVATGSIVQQSIDSGAFGYDESVTSLLVPANGGSASTHAYSALDDSYGPWTASTDSSLVLAANIASGIVYQDVYLDIRGANLNYEVQDAVDIAHKGFLWVPFCDTSKFTDGYFGLSSGVGGGTNLGYDAVYRKYAFHYFASASNEGVSGAFLKSDLFGRFVTESASASANRTIQTVGRIVTTDSRFPKELTEDIQNYPGIETMSNQTAGVPTDLFVFVRDILTANSLNVGKNYIRDRIRNGEFGYTRVELDV